MGNKRILTTTMDVLFKLENNLFTQVLEDIIKNLYDLNHIPVHNLIDVYLISKIKEDIKNIIFETNLNANKVIDWFSTRNINDPDKIQIFITVLDENKSRILYLTLIHHYCPLGETINTFDWKLKLICGSSELKTLSFLLLQLALYTVSVNHKPTERLYELNKDMLFRLIGALEQFVGNDNVN